MARGKIILEADGSRLSAGLRQAQGAVSSASAGMASALTAALAPAAVLTGLRQMVEEFSRIADLSQRGFSTDFLQDLSATARLAGSDLESAVKAFSRLAAEVNSATGPSKQLAASLEALGVSVDELRGKSPEQFFTIVGKAIGEIKDESQQLAAINDILTARYADLQPLLREYAQNGLTPVTKATADQIKRAEEFGDRLDTLTMNVKGMLIPVLDTLIGAYNRVSGAMEAIGAGFGVVVQGAERAAQAIGRIIDIAKQGGRGGFVSFEDIGKSVKQSAEDFSRDVDAADAVMRGATSRMLTGDTPSAPAASGGGAGAGRTYEVAREMTAEEEKAADERFAAMRSNFAEELQIREEEQAQRDRLAEEEAEAERERQQLVARAMQRAQEERVRALEDERIKVQSEIETLPQVLRANFESFNDPRNLGVSAIQAVGGGGGVGTRPFEKFAEEQRQTNARLAQAVQRLEQIRTALDNLAM